MLYISENLSVNDKNHLTIGKSDAVELAKKYKTPLYVMDEDLIRKKCRIYTDAIDKYYNSNGLVLYASKAFSCKEIYRIAKEEKLGIDAVSGGEIYTALAAGFPAEKIFFHGNNKTDDELEMAVKCKVGYIVADNEYELERLERICKEHAHRQKIIIRVTPGVDAHTHDFIKTGQIDSKFGATLEGGDAMRLIKKAIDSENVILCGVHCHIGSQIFDVTPFEHTAKIMIDLICDVRNEFGYTLKMLDLGGGLGIKYVQEDDPAGYDEFIKSVSAVIDERCKERGIDMPMILMEPGRSIVASAGVTLYTAGTIKNIPGIRKYVSVDGGMCDNPRYILYQAKYTAVNASRASDDASDVITLAGKCCESGDLIGENMRIQTVKEGDIIAVLATGAYNYSMSSNYNRLTRPAVVMVKDGTDRIIVKAETYEDLIRNDI